MIARTPSAARRTRSLRRVRQRCGVAVVEFAVVIPIFFLFFMILIEFGRGFMVMNLLNNAARVGCREGILPNRSDSDIESAVNAAIANQGLSGVTTTVKVNNVVQNASGAVSNDEITVTVNAPVSQNTWIPGIGFLSGSLSGQYTMTRE